MITAKKARKIAYHSQDEYINIINKIELAAKEGKNSISEFLSNCQIEYLSKLGYLVENEDELADGCYIILW